MIAVYILDMGRF